MRDIIVNTTIGIKKIIPVIIVIVLILSNFSCKLFCDEDESHQKKIFNPANLSKLSLDKIDSFWDDDSIKHVSDFIDETFNTHLEYLVGTRYSSDSKMIVVSVFNSQYGAIEAMELRRNNVAVVIKNGINNEFISGKWWFSQNPSSLIFLNKLNVIIEVLYNDYPTYAENETVLIQTAVEIAKRIDALGN